MLGKFIITCKVVLRRFKQLSYFVGILLSKKGESEKFNNDKGFKGNKSKHKK